MVAGRAGPSAWSSSSYFLLVPMRAAEAHHPVGWPESTSVALWEALGGAPKRKSGGPATAWWECVSRFDLSISHQVQILEDPARAKRGSLSRVTTAGTPHAVDISSWLVDGCWVIELHSPVLLRRIGNYNYLYPDEAGVGGPGSEATPRG